MVGVMLNLSAATMIGSAIPDDLDVAVVITQPKAKLVEKRASIIAVTGAIMPDETLPAAEIISPVPVEPIFQRQTVTGYPIVLSFDRPAIAKLKVLMEVDFIDIDQA